MRIEISSSEDLEKVIESNIDVYEKHLFVDENSGYAKILRACGIKGRSDKNKSEKYQPVSFGLVAYGHCLSQGVSFISNAEVFYGKQKTSFIVSNKFLDSVKNFEKFDPTEFSIWIFSPGIYSEEFTQISGGSCLYRKL